MRIKWHGVGNSGVLSVDCVSINVLLVDIVLQLFKIFLLGEMGKEAVLSKSSQTMNNCMINTEM